MITQLLIEPTANALAYIVTSWGLTDDGSPVSSTLNLKTDKQNILDLLNSPSISVFTTPIRIKIYFNDDGSVSLVDVFDKASGSNIITSDVLDQATSDQAISLRLIVEGQPVVKTSTDPISLKDVSTKDEA